MLYGIIGKLLPLFRLECSILVMVFLCLLSSGHRYLSVRETIALQSAVEGKFLL